MDRDEVLDKLKSVINSLIKDDASDPESAKAGHAEAATKDLHDVITAKMRERVVGSEPEREREPEPDADDEVPDDEPETEAS